MHLIMYVMPTACNFNDEKGIYSRYYPVNFAQSFRIAFIRNTSRSNELCQNFIFGERVKIFYHSTFFTSAESLFVNCKTQGIYSSGILRICKKCTLQSIQLSLQNNLKNPFVF